MLKPDLDIPPLWAQALAYLKERRPKKVLILGATDVGKSTLCFYLAKNLLKNGVSVAVIDADVGQKDIGPPTTIGLRHFENEIPPGRPLMAEALYFVGSTTPVGHLLPLVVGTRWLCDQSKAEVSIINTTGLVRGPGIPLKSFQIESLRPNIILALERQGELEPILSAYRYLEILRLPVSTKVLPKSPTERRYRRQEAFRRHFEGAQTVFLSLEDLILQRLPQKGLRRYLLCGVADKRAQVLALGIIEEFDPAHGRVTILTPAPRERIKILICGSLYLNRLGEELGRDPLTPLKRRSYPKARSFPSPRLRSRRGQPPLGERSRQLKSPVSRKRLRNQKSPRGPRGRNVPEKGE